MKPGRIPIKKKRTFLDVNTARVEVDSDGGRIRSFTVFDKTKGTVTEYVVNNDEVLKTWLRAEAHLDTLVPTTTVRRTFVSAGQRIAKSKKKKQLY